MTRIVVLPADKTACGFYRMRCPAGVVGELRPDWDIEVYDPGDVKLGVLPNGSLQSLLGVADPRGIDLLVMQRVGTRAQVELLEWARDQGIATVMDTDDAMWAIDPENASWSSWNGGSTPTSWLWLERAALVVDLVTVTTEALAQRYENRGARAQVLPNCVPGDSLDLPSMRGELDPTLTIGWAGFTGTHPHDLEVVGSAVRDVVEETGCRVRVIGDAQGAAKAWGLKEIDQIPPVPLGPAYYTALSSLDVALVPLRSTTFNRAKSYLKAMEFASMGVPVIASDTPAHRELQKHVPIYLARTTADWYRGLLFLLQNQKYREAAAQQGREAVRDKHTYEQNATAWAGAWERALTRRSRLAV